MHLSFQRKHSVMKQIKHQEKTRRKLFLKSNLYSQYDFLRYYINEKGTIESRGQYFQREIVMLKMTNIVEVLKNRMNSKLRN